MGKGGRNFVGSEKRKKLETQGCSGGQQGGEAGSWEELRPRPAGPAQEETARTETGEKHEEGAAARWVPASYLRSWSWRGPPRPHRPAPCAAPAAGSPWAPACPWCWPSSPGSCCWSLAPWSAGAAARDPEDPGPCRQAGEAGWGGEEGQRSSRQPAPPPFLLLTTVYIPCDEHFTVCMTLLPTPTRSFHTQRFQEACVSVVSEISIWLPYCSASPLKVGTRGPRSPNRLRGRTGLSPSFRIRKQKPREVQ